MNYYWNYMNHTTGEIAEYNKPFPTIKRAWESAMRFATRPQYHNTNAIIRISKRPHIYSDPLDPNTSDAYTILEWAELRIGVN